MKKNYSYLLIEHDPDGRTNEVTTTLVAILGADTKEEIERLALRTIAKQRANGDYTKIPFFEGDINAEERAMLHEAIATDNPGIPCVPSAFYTLQPIEMKEWPRRGKNDYTRHMAYVVLDEKTGDYREVGEDEVADAIAVDIADIDGLDSPFIYATPFIVKNGRLYAVDAEAGNESGPYDKAEWDYGYYVVSRDGKTGLVSLTGRKLTDCDYDFAFYTNGIAILGKDGKNGLYSPWHDVLIPCEYDEIECMPEDRAYVIATKDGVQGLIATDGTFHPETDEDPDDSFEYL